MKKKLYISPVTEVTEFGSEVIMQVFGPASMPNDQFQNPAPRHRSEVF